MGSPQPPDPSDPARPRPIFMGLDTERGGAERHLNWAYYSIRTSPRTDPGESSGGGLGTAIGAAVVGYVAWRIVRRHRGS